MNLKMNDVKSGEKLNLNLNEQVKLDTDEEVEYYKQHGLSKETFKHMGKEMLQGSVDSYKPKNLVNSYIQNFILLLCVILPPVGFIVSLFRLKNKDAGAVLAAKIGIVLAIIIQIIWIKIIF